MRSCADVYEEQENKWYPKRLIHVGDQNRPPCLIFRETERLEGGYVALSHCWGKNPQFITLTSSNIDDFQRGIPFHELPASFRGAIITCRRLEIPYLWIDSLCIIQSGEGSNADWLLQSSEMHKVYLNCKLNIAINHASNPEEGAFVSRDPDLLQDCFVWTPFHGPPTNKYRNSDSQSNSGADSQSESASDANDIAEDIRNQEADTGLGQTFICTVFTRQDFTYARQYLALNQRAWVLQEKLLSPRTLHFQADRIVWECEERRALSEYPTKRMGDNRIRDFNCLYQTEYNIGKDINQWDFNRLYQTSYNIRTDIDQWEYLGTCIFQYMARELSHPAEDKLVAFGAIARQISRQISGEYCAGIFRTTLPYTLLWEVMLLGSPRPNRATIYRAPSWSWASIDGRARPNTHRVKGAVALSSVEDVQIDLVDPTNPYGQVKFASLTLTGPLISWNALAGDQTMKSEVVPWRWGLLYGPPYGPISVRSCLEQRIYLSPDDLGTVFPEESDWIYRCFSPLNDVFIIAITGPTDDQGPAVRVHRYDKYRGLILRRLSTGFYGRIGTWEAENGFLETHAQVVGGRVGFQKETITII